MSLFVPTVHLNGTSKNELLEQILGAYNALGKALDAMAKAAPHMRDYYVKKYNADVAFNAATFQHHERIRKVTAIREEYEKIYLALEEGKNATN